MRTRSVTYAVALFGLLTMLTSTIMLSRLLVRLGAGRASPGEALLELATSAGAAWFWLSLIGAGAWGGAWLLAERHALPGERDKAGRKAMLYIGQMAALGALLLQTVLLIASLFTQPKPAGAAAQAVGLAAGGVIALTFWAFLRWNALKDGDFGQETAAAAGWRRLYYYGGAAVTLALFLAGLMELLRIILGVSFGVSATDVALAANRVRFAQAAAFALVGAPAWWALWWSQQTRAYAPGESGTAERRSATRRLYLYGIVLVAAVAFFFGLGMSIVGAVARRDLTIAAAWVPIALIALAGLAGHLLTLRGDELAMADEGQQSARPPRGMEGRVSAAQPVSRRKAEEVVGRAAAAAEPRRFAREALPVAPLPARPPIILVIDGRDGALGARLIAGLAAALPDVLIWPMGLNAAAQVAQLNALGGALPVAPANAAARATLIVGPSDMLIPGGLAGEVTAELAAAIAGSPARKLLLPPRAPTLRWVAAPAWPEERWVENAVIEATNLVNEQR